MSALQPDKEVCPRVLVVDDDVVTQTLIAHHLKRNGFEILLASSVTAAQSIVINERIDSLQAVVTDYLMPDGTGLELIEWLKRRDDSIGTIIVTAIGERDLVKQSLRGGACDFLDKPVQIAALLQSTRNAVEHTTRGRHLKDTESSVQEVARFQQSILGPGSDFPAAPVEICWHPMHPVGGDLVNLIPLGQNRLLVLAADVSGHDLKAGFISAYFQGVVRGMVEKGTPIKEVFQYFNQFLVSEWSRSQQTSGGNECVAASISACAFVVDFQQKRLAIFNSGFPTPIWTHPHGTSEPCGRQSGFPLGWFADDPVGVSERDIAAGGSIYIWTDGLEDLAGRLGASPVALATELLAARRDGRVAECLKLAKDDILLVQLKLGSVPNGDIGAIPLIYQEIQAGQEPLIDEFQASWEKSLRLALPDVAEDRISDVLLCAREAVINAIRYGCSHNTESPGTLQISRDANRSLLRVVVDDHGPGHNFQWQQHLNEATDELIGAHRGLALMHQLPTETRIDRQGAKVTMDFSLHQP